MFRKPFRAVPIRPGKRYRRKQRAARWFVPALVALPLAAFTAVFFWGGPPAGLTQMLDTRAGPVAGSRDSESAHFDRCGSGPRITCIVDGDTFWYRGEKIRIADINTPEISSPGCPAEMALGQRATRRMLVLLNEGPFSLEMAAGDNRDRYGRLLRVVTRQGHSLGDVLVAEGLAEEWQGYRRNWC